jgi:DNA-binding IclR family transcriptional regulator
MEFQNMKQDSSRRAKSSNSRKPKAPEKIGGSPYQVQVLDRALSILEILSSDGAEFAPAEVSEQLGLHKSTTHRLLAVLERHRLVWRNPQTGKYRLGLKLFELGSKAVAQLDLRERVRPYLERLVLKTGETAHLCILNDGEMLSLANVESPRTLRTPSTVGRRTPLHCTSVGKALLAFLPEGEAESLIKERELRAYTGKTITKLARLKSEWRLVRERGYAVDDEEIEDGMRCIGAPVRDYSGRVIAAISIAGAAFRLTDERIALVAREVVEAATQFSAELGYQETQQENEVEEVERIKAVG